MPAVDTSFYQIPSEQESGAGEMKCCKPAPCSSSHAVVSEIMNDILDNTWEIIMAKSIQKPPKVETISPNVVGDILHTILSSPRKTNDNTESELLDEEIKKIIREMKFPPEQRSIISTKGVGDQLGSKSEVTLEKMLPESPKRNILERKSRLMNLVRNSKHMLSKLVTKEENPMKEIKSEELHEELLKIVDLDSGKTTIYTEEGSSTGIIQVPSESTMDIVDLESDIQIETENPLEKDEKQEATSSFSKIPNKKTTNKKKWNLGAKIMKCLKKRPKKEQN